MSARKLAFALTFALAFAAACDKSSSEGSGASPSAASTPPPAASTASPASAAAAPSAAPTAKAPPDRVAAQHVLVAYKGAKGAPKGVTRSKAEAKALADDVAKRARAGEDFAELAKKHSDDQGSRERMGSVGMFTRDKMVKEFSDAAFALAVDQVSDPVESPFGFHVIKRNQ
jgi:peptidyl-prolyl cis-trans isomerase NIMA-interacting 1